MKMSFVEVVEGAIYISTINNFHMGQEHSVKLALSLPQLLVKKKKLPFNRQEP